MTDKPTPTTDLLKRCAEIHEWRSTGLLSGEALRDYAKRKWSGRLDTLQMAEHETVTEALALLAKWGQPAQAAEPVAVVAPCHTPSGKRVALYSAKQDLPIGTKLYTAPQPSPTAQAAPAAGAVAGASEVVAYLDVGAGGYLDLGTDLCEEALQRLPKGRHALVIAGTYGIDGYAAAPTPAAQADSVPAQVLVAALIAAKQAINSMKAEAETAAQGDEQMMLEACETISNEGLQADIAIRAALASAQQPAPSAAVLDYPHARRFGGCPACGRSDCVAMSCTRTTSDDLLHIAARKQGGKHDNH